MIAVIMQPTYLPWIGYFDLMDRADVFVVLDTVQFEKQSWQQRNRIKTGEGRAQWMTVPVIQNLGQSIHSVKISEREPWERKHWATIEQNYRRSSYWMSYRDGLATIYSRPWERLVDLNLAIIRYLVDGFGIQSEIVRSSEMPVSGTRVGLLINICHYVNADVYLSPPGSACYIEEDNRFAEEGITLEYQKYDHPVYRQLYGDFISHMSAIDLLFNEGHGSLEIIRSGRVSDDNRTAA